MFKKLLDESRAEYHFYGKHNILSIDYDNVENIKEIKQAIQKLCDRFGYINALKVRGKAVLEVSNNPKAIKDFGFKSEEYIL